MFRRKFMCEKIVPLRARNDVTDRCRFLTAKSRALGDSNKRPLWDRNLTWLPIIAVMLVKESSDLALQLSCVLQLAH